MSVEYFNVLVRYGQPVADIGGPYPSKMAAIFALSSDAAKLYATRPEPLDTETVAVGAPRYREPVPPKTWPPVGELPPLPLPPLPKLPPLK